MIERVSVVIPTRNGADTIGAVLDAVFAQKHRFALDVVVVDSASTDGTRALLARHPIRVETIQPSDFDHGATRNLGISLSRGEVVVLLTQDAVPADETLLENLVRTFEEPRVAGVFARQIPRPDCDVVRRRQLESWLTGRREPARVALDGLALASLPPFERYSRCVFDNVCSALRRDVWQEIPFPRSSFGEDVAWGRAALEAGWTLAYEPSAAVVHSHRRPIPEEYRREREAHRRLYELFEVAAVPRRRDVVRGIWWQLRHEMPYVWRHAPPGAERWRQLARIAGLSVAAPIGQHQGYRDAVRAGGRQV